MEKEREKNHRHLLGQLEKWMQSWGSGKCRGVSFGDAYAMLEMVVVSRWVLERESEVAYHFVDLCEKGTCLWCVQFTAKLLG